MSGVNRMQGGCSWTIRSSAACGGSTGDGSRTPQRSVGRVRSPTADDGRNVATPIVVPLPVPATFVQQLRPTHTASTSKERSRRRRDLQTRFTGTCDEAAFAAAVAAGGAFGTRSGSGWFSVLVEQRGHLGGRRSRRLRSVIGARNSRRSSAQRLRRTTMSWFATLGPSMIDTTSNQRDQRRRM